MGANIKNRPMPDDFADMAVDMAIPAIMAHYGCADRTATRWLSELPADVLAKRNSVMNARKCAGARAQFKEKPANFELICMTMQVKALASYYQASAWCITRWLGELPADVAAERARRLRHLFPRNWTRRQQAAQIGPPAPIPDEARMAQLIREAAEARAAAKKVDRYAGLTGFDRQLAAARDNGVTVIPTRVEALPDRSLTGSQMALLS